jgi:hypothetical protein
MSIDDSVIGPSDALNATDRDDEDLGTDVDVYYVKCVDNSCNKKAATHYGVQCLACHGICDDTVSISLAANQVLDAGEPVHYVECRGSKCRSHWHHLKGLHCGSCYGDDEYPAFMQILFTGHKLRKLVYARCDRGCMYDNEHCVWYCNCFITDF